MAVDRVWVELEKNGVYQFLEPSSGGQILNKVYDDLAMGKVRPEEARRAFLAANWTRLTNFLVLWRNKFVPALRAACARERVEWARESEKTFFRMLWSEFEPMTVYQVDEEWMQIVKTPAMEAARQSLKHQICTELAARFKGLRTPQDAEWAPPSPAFLSSS